MSPNPAKKRRGERFVSRPGDVVFVEPGQEPQRPGARERGSPPLELGQLRRARHITQTELAHELGVDQAQISRLERGSDPHLSSVIEYLEGLGAREVELDVKFADGTQVTLPIARAR
jgi:DNA-binding XRE family transcriptional regulator